MSENVHVYRILVTNFNLLGLEVYIVSSSHYGKSDTIYEPNPFLLDRLCLCDSLDFCSIHCRLVVFGFA